MSSDSIDASADSTTAPAPSTDSTSTASSWASSLPPDSIILVPNQLSKRILSPGDPSSSRIPNGAQVTVHYTGKLLDGTIFDSSHKRNDPFQFKIGLSQVIKGWDEGVATMKKGEKALLRCEPEYAYGKRGSPPTIPPNATLEFEVDLLDYNDRENVTEDGGITKKVLVTGTSGTLVTEYSKVIVSFIGKIKGEKGAVDQVFVEKKNQSWVIGDDDGLPQGLEESILSMTQKEKSEFLVTRKHGFGAEGSKEFSIPIPPNATLIYEVEVDSVEKPKPLFQLQFKEVLDLMIRIKDIGNKAYKKSLDPKVLPATREKLFERSLKKWNSALQLFESEDEIKSEEDKKLVIPVKLSLLTNIAIVKLKQKSFNDVLENANKALELDPKNVKAIFKKGQALAGLGQDDEAIRAFKQAQELDSDNKEIVKEINAIKKKNAEIIAKERKAFGGFFNKVSLVSKEEEEASRKAAEAEKAKMAVDSDSDEEDEPASSSTADGAGSTSSDAEKVNDERADTEKKLDNDVPIEKSEKPASAE